MLRLLSTVAEVKLNSDLARGMCMAELFMTSPNERMSKQDASILFVLRMADMTEPWSESSSLYCSCKTSNKLPESTSAPARFQCCVFYHNIFGEEIFHVRRQEFTWRGHLIPVVQLTR